MGHMEIVEVLLEYHADVHGGCTYRTPLVFAADNPQIRTYLVDHGAKETIFTAAAEGDTAKISAYVNKDSSLVHLTDEEDMTPLFFSAGRHDLDGMTFFLEAGADPNAVATGTVSYGITPIHAAAEGFLKRALEMPFHCW